MRLSQIGSLFFYVSRPFSLRFPAFGRLGFLFFWACWLFLQGAHAAPYAGVARYRAFCLFRRSGFFAGGAHAAPCTPAPAPAGLFLWVCWRVCGLLGGNVSQFCALFRLFWRKRDWNCATLPHPGDDAPPEPPRSSAKLSSQLWGFV